MRNVVEKSGGMAKESKENLADYTIESRKTECYNPTHNLKRSVGDLKNSLVIIDALYKKGMINMETLLKIKKKYGEV